MRILIVDDNQTIVLLLSSLLKKWGHEVVVAENGELAWQLLQHDKIQFVISDWMMPCMDGATLCIFHNDHRNW
jgi:CheY-like chemotaxis protein